MKKKHFGRKIILLCIVGAGIYLYINRQQALEKLEDIKGDKPLTEIGANLDYDEIVNKTQGKFEEFAERAINDTNEKIASDPEKSGADTLTDPVTIGEYSTATLSSAEDIDLHSVDGGSTNYVFTYNGEDFKAKYTRENWRITDSYKISNYEDMLIICQALLDEHIVHGRDMVSARTAEDMVYEWLQHNIAYAVLPEGSSLKQHAKNVDFDPEDQGKSYEELYEDRTGQKFDAGEILGKLKEIYDDI